MRLLLALPPSAPAPPFEGLLKESLGLDSWLRHAVMSSESSTDFIASALQAGAADYLIKPVQRSAVTMLWQHVWRITSCRAGLRVRLRLRATWRGAGGGMES